MITRNAARCKSCDTVVESKHVHDFVTCPCGKISVDGGREYLKRSCDDLSMYEDLSEDDGPEPVPFKVDVKMSEKQVTGLVEAVYKSHEVNKSLDQHALSYLGGKGVDVTTNSSEDESVNTKKGISSDKLKEWRGVYDESTEGPWEWGYADETIPTKYKITDPSDSFVIPINADRSDLKFVVTAHEAFPLLLDEVERLRGLLEGKK